MSIAEATMVSKAVVQAICCLRGAEVAFALNASCDDAAQARYILIVGLHLWAVSGSMLQQICQDQQLILGFCFVARKACRHGLPLHLTASKAFTSEAANALAAIFTNLEAWRPSQLPARPPQASARREPSPRPKKEVSQVSLGPPNAPGSQPTCQIPPTPDSFLHELLGGCDPAAETSTQAKVPEAASAPRPALTTAVIKPAANAAPKPEGPLPTSKPLEKECRSGSAATAAEEDFLDQLLTAPVAPLHAKAKRPEAAERAPPPMPAKASSSGCKAAREEPATSSLGPEKAKAKTATASSKECRSAGPRKVGANGSKGRPSKHKETPKKERQPKEPTTVPTVPPSDGLAAKFEFSEEWEMAGSPQGLPVAASLRPPPPVPQAPQPPQQAEAAPQPPAANMWEDVDTDDLPVMLPVNRSKSTNDQQALDSLETESFQSSVVERSKSSTAIQRQPTKPPAPDVVYTCIECKIAVSSARAMCRHKKAAHPEEISARRIRCRLCSIWCHCLDTFRSHLEGRQHTLNERSEAWMRALVPADKSVALGPKPSLPLAGHAKRTTQSLPPVTGESFTEGREREVYLTQNLVRAMAHGQANGRELPAAESGGHSGAQPRVACHSRHRGRVVQLQSYSDAYDSGSAESEDAAWPLQPPGYLNPGGSSEMAVAWSAAAAADRAHGWQQAPATQWGANPPVGAHYPPSWAPHSADNGGSISSNGQGYWMEECLHPRLAAPAQAPLVAPREKIPSMFICPITKRVMLDPVTLCDGQTYERAAIEDYLRRYGRSPTGMPLPAHAVLEPNHTVRLAMANYVGLGADAYE